MSGHVLGWRKGVTHTRCILLTILLVVFPAHAWAQTQLGTLFGTVIDSSGAVVPNAEVSLENVSTGLRRDGRTDTKGEYQLAGLPTGRYTLRVEKEGFQTEVREGIALSPGATIGINLSLVVGKLSVRVTIEAGVPAGDTTSTVGGIIAERRLTALPLDGRDLFKTAVLQYGIAPTPTTPTIACSLTNGTPFTGHGSERQTSSVNCPGDTGKNPTVTGSGTADKANVNITGQ